MEFLIDFCLAENPNINLSMTAIIESITILLL